MNKTLVIIGAGAHSRKLLHYAQALGYQVLAFVDDNPAAVSPSAEIACLSVQAADKFGIGQSFIVAIGNGNIRRRLLEEFEKKGWRAISLLHPSSYVAPDAMIGRGTVVCAHAVVETGVCIGIGVIVDIGSLLDHDCIINDYCHIRVKESFLPGTTVDAR